MRIWLHGGEPPADTGHISFGRIGRAGNLPTLQEIATSADISAANGAAAYFVPPGRALDEALLAGLAKTGRDVLVAVNGLGARGIKMVRNALPPNRRILSYDAADAENAALFEQVAWLAAQSERFAIRVARGEQLMAAALAGADSALAPDAEMFDLGALDRVLAARASGAARPAAPTEVDGLAGREFCLTVTRPMDAGETLAEADLAIAITGYRGLAPTMKHAAAGRRLRYAVAPGEPIHFGLLK